MKTVTLMDGTRIPALGQGTWYMGEDPLKHDSEIETLRWGIENGMTLIDSAEMYGEGAAEELVGQAIQGYDRSSLFLVSKVYPWNADRDHIFSSCEQSLKRMKTSSLDLYLLHWRGNVPLAETVDCMEELVDQGMIKRWGVSNFDTLDMKELMDAGGYNCMCDQVLYHLGSRGVEYDLLPWLKKNGMALMSYCPLAHSGALRRKIASSPVVQKVADAHQATAAQVMLAFVIHDSSVFAVPKASSLEHVKENCGAMDLRLSDEEYAALSSTFPAPTHKVELDML